MQCRKLFWFLFPTICFSFAFSCYEVLSELGRFVEAQFAIFSCFSEKHSFAHSFYFWVSLVYLIGRTLAVSLYSASINDESKKPLEVFRSVSRQDWCPEVKRFNEEVANDTIALSGMKFFFFTRSLVLSVAGTIVTYGLIPISGWYEDI